MTVMRVAVHGGQVLTYDTDDVQDITFSTPNDVHEIGVTEKGYALRELGQSHLTLRAHFKPGKRAVWVDQAEAMLPDLRMGGDMLKAALDMEGIPPALASRVWNRFFFAAPDGPDAAYRFDHEPADCPGRVEMTRMADPEPQWTHGKTCTEAARLKTPLADELVAQVHRGIAEAERGETVDLGSFAQELDEDDEANDD